ncbi:DNA topoisomerase IV subunit A [Aeribacillus composti]|uniref:DNA topoisomerase 4 subunit A n=1 Tax=Aeribacillus composti TaxID=1868734 RepID=A0ABY9W5W4_9BACI|nr:MULTISPECIES: DNA topoisomerase IV subunit A [Aeribacillus]KZM55622.1 DNA gyrase subunit A [Aeribacillus pallidus]MED0651083.1 DNA topoisomerase IV subunit A [Aeribacillus composti]MED4487635.1 DNA topoisomerase IV subunit A [Aeribacillus pallidus]TVZ80265.1 topoisomerase-4 subunit A [Aeribacillus composti]WNF31541.1 DNA topoisomerase IV subunit A [Aeribacillus composti]
MEAQQRYVDLPLEDVLGDRFGRYSKYIIQDRALPDVRDGLKPVQRRILYAMLMDGNTHDKGFRKAAKTVGNVIGNFHPHGDSSVYEAMVRMSQEWKVRNVLVEMHGNNGSLDGDPPAAMRYTEARLSKLASELLKDIEKNTVEFVPNFDDTTKEPVVLPAMFPNLLVNGSTGISAGYATDIPPHNLGEVIDAVIMRMNHPDCTVEELMEVLKGPDFPTGGIIQGIDEIKKAYKTGKGKIVVRGKAEIEKIRGGKEQIVITEIPYEVNKANLVKKIDDLKYERKVDGIAEVRDETDRTGLRIVIELKKDADAEGVLNYLYKNTDLQVPYNFNMVAIHRRHPKLLSLPELLDAYIEHRKEVVINRSTFELQKAQEREHVVKGLIKALSILDEVIAVIRASKDKRDAKDNLISEFAFTEPQAEAIVSLQLYRLTNTDITALKAEEEELEKKIKGLTSILEDEKKLSKVIQSELKQLKKTFADERRTKIEAEIESITINMESLIASEDTIVTVTKDGYVKRTSLRSYTASNGKDFGMKDSDRLLCQYEMNTTDVLLLFTNKGNYLYCPVHELPDIRWKDIGQHISRTIPIDQDERIVQGIPLKSFDDEKFFLFVTKKGMVKKTEIRQYKAQRYSKPLVAINLKDDDEVVAVHITDGTGLILLSTRFGYGLLFHEEEVNIVGSRAAGVKGIQLKEGDAVVSGLVFAEKHVNDQKLAIVTHRGAVKMINIGEIERTQRARRGSMLYRELKTNPHRTAAILLVNGNENLVLETEKGIREIVPLSNVKVTDRYSNGSFYIDKEEAGEVADSWLETEA